MLAFKFLTFFMLMWAAQADVIQSAGLILYTPNTQAPAASVKYSLSNAVNILSDPNFDITRKTVIYIFGYVENPSLPTVQAIIAAFRTRGDHNIIVLDWTEGAAEFYPKAVENAKDISEVFGQAICQLIAAGVQRDLLHLVGHSLGAQLAGLAGQETKTNCSTTLKRITALDPALPEFLGAPANYRLSKTDAEMLYVIHTDMLAYGTTPIDGTVNFLVNGGTRYQCGCVVDVESFIPLTPSSLCSHQRSVYYFAESIVSNNFQATPCSTDLLFRLGACPPPTTPVYMGLTDSSVLTGNYFLNTGKTSPYGRGANGAVGTILRCTL